MRECSELFSHYYNYYDDEVKSGIGYKMRKLTKIESSLEANGLSFVFNPRLRCYLRSKLLSLYTALIGYQLARYPETEALSGFCVDQLFLHEQEDMPKQIIYVRRNPDRGI